MTNECNKTLGAKGAANATCIVTIALQPSRIGTNTIQLTLAYNKNRVPLPMLSTQSTSAATADNMTGSVTMPLPSKTYTGTNYDVAFAYINLGAATITPTAVTVTGFTATTNTCTGTALAPNSPPCTITGTFSPTQTGARELNVVYSYQNTNGKTVSVPLKTQTVVYPGGGACHQVSGFAYLPFPTSSYIYADNVVRFDFTNQCDSGSETIGTIHFTSSSSATITKGTDNCSGHTLAANSTCSIFASVVPTQTASDLTLTASLPYNGNAATAVATTNETVNAVPSNGNHTVMFVNQCDQNVWYEFQNGAGGTGAGRKSPDPTPSTANKFSDYQLNAQLPGAPPSVKVLSVSEYVNGAIYGRTKCNTATGVCQTASCPVISGTGTCQVSVGAPNPTTIFETNMDAAAASDGVYDVSVINGFNIPGEVKSLMPISSNPFGCGQSAGALIQPVGSSLGACPWVFTPPSTVSPDAPENYYWVSSGAQDGCTSSNNCSAGQVCGMAYSSSTTSEGTTPINRRCGTFLGYRTIADYIGYTAIAQWGTLDLFTSYGLGTLLPGSYGNAPATPPNAPATYADMYGCVVTDNNSLNTGYGTGTPPNPLPNTNTCGCYDWNQAGSVVPTAQASQCTQTNSLWTSTVFDRIKWLKQACPTAYSYQFDDKSVSFQCNVTAQKTSYQIIYCPGGKTGAPAQS